MIYCGNASVCLTPPLSICFTVHYSIISLLFIDIVIMRSGGWYYKARLGRTRGPCELITLKTAWGSGIIDKRAFIWVEDMDEWAPIHMVHGLEPAIATWEVETGGQGYRFGILFHGFCID